jgi:hypothetical protein
MVGAYSPIAAFLYSIRASPTIVAAQDSHRWYAEASERRSRRGAQSSTTKCKRRDTDERVGRPVTLRKNGHDRPANEKARRFTTAPSPSPELLALVQAAEDAFLKLMALFVAHASAERVHLANTGPKEWMTEKEVAKMTRMSCVWFQRAREEGIGPHYDKIASCVRYPRAVVERWIESGDAARAHLTSRPPKKGKNGSRALLNEKGGTSSATSALAPCETGTDDDIE